MARIQITMQHHLHDVVATQRAQQIATRFSAKFEGLSAKWSDPATLMFSATDGVARGVSGTLRVGPSSVTLDLDLPLLLSLGKQAIEDAAREEMARSLR